jgi:hypothetical protein
MEPIRFSIRMGCGHRIDQTCLPGSRRGLTSDRCLELCLSCDRAQLCQTKSHGRRHLARLDALTRLVLPLRGTPDFELLGAQLQWLAIRKAVMALQITEAREQFRQRWYTQTQTTSAYLQRFINDLLAIERDLARVEGMLQAVVARHAAAD